ncbi:SH3 domain-containing protein [Phenylobacterium sp.]|jgi:SH3-like domain-containing protein|uniref:SH3 domain-containing protein n=1 Tax=Phenylobacterium sp. TaxID=1871053 RepID=UPI0037C773ED
MNGQGEPSGRRRGAHALILSVAACALASAALADARPTPSGLPVPRFVTLKFGSVNARAGPGDDYRTLWVYQVRGLPVQVIAESSEWRRICDPDGGVAWVHMRTTDGRRNVLPTTGAAVPVLSSPHAGARTLALLQPRSLAALQRCESGWCRIQADGVSGWVQAAGLWGTDDRPQCLIPPPAR